MFQLSISLFNLRLSTFLTLITMTQLSLQMSLHLTRKTKIRCFFVTWDTHTPLPMGNHFGRILSHLLSPILSHQFGAVLSKSFPDTSVLPLALEISSQPTTGRLSRLAAQQAVFFKYSFGLSPLLTHSRRIDVFQTVLYKILPPPAIAAES